MAETIIVSDSTVELFNSVRNIYKEIISESLDDDIFTFTELGIYEVYDGSGKNILLENTLATQLFYYDEGKDLLSYVGQEVAKFVGTSNSLRDLTGKYNLVIGGHSFFDSYYMCREVNEADIINAIKSFLLIRIPRIAKDVKRMKGEIQWME